MVSIEISKLSDFLHSWGAKVQGMFLHSASKQEKAFRERIAQGLRSLVRKVQEGSDIVANQAPVIKQVMGAVEALEELDSRTNTALQVLRRLLRP